MPRGRYLISTTDQPRVRRASDATVAVLALIVFVLAWRSYNRVPDSDAAMDELVGWIPSWLEGTFSVLRWLCSFSGERGST